MQGDRHYSRSSSNSRFKPVVSSHSPGNHQFRYRNIEWNAKCTPIHQQRLDQVHYHDAGTKNFQSPPRLRKEQAEAWERMEKLPITKRAFISRHRPTVPPGYVHVRFFPDLNDLRRKFWWPTREAVFPLELDGGFDLKHIKKLWRLDVCTPVSPIRWTPVAPTTPDHLSPMAVMILLEIYGCISFVGTEIPWKEPDFEDKVKSCADTAVSGFRASQVWLSKSMQDTFLDRSFKEAQAEVHYLGLRFKWWINTFSTLQKALFIFMIFLLLGILIFANRFLSLPMDTSLVMHRGKNNASTTHSFVHYIQDIIGFSNESPSLPYAFYAKP